MGNYGRPPASKVIDMLALLSGTDDSETKLKEISPEVA
jgi:hypothetical protein